MQIFVKTAAEKTVAVQVEASDAVERVAAAVQARTGSRPGQRFLFGGKQLSAGRPLSDYNVQAESTLHEVLGLAGGMSGRGRGRGRGRKPKHKGKRRQFTSGPAEEMDEQKKEALRKWREKKGIESSDEDEDGSGDAKGGSDFDDAEESSDEEDEEEGEKKPRKAKGVEGLIDIQNPNRAPPKVKKAKDLDVADGARQLTRREREEIQKQRAKAKYDKLHAEGKTDEAQSDLARLALIRKKRAEDKKRREAEEARKKKALEAKGGRK